MAIKMFFGCFLFIFASVLKFQSVASLEEYKLGVLLPYSYDSFLDWEYSDGKRYASAVTLAVEKVNKDPTLLNGAKLSFIWNNTGCNETKMIKQQHWQIKQGVVGFVGPSCHVRKAARIAKKHELGLVSFDCQDTHVSNKKLFPNFARTNSQHSNAALKILSLVKENGLERVSIVQEEGTKWDSMRRYLSRLLRSKGVKIIGTHKLDQLAFHLEVPKSIYAIPLESKATIMVASLDKAREVMYNMQAHFEKNPSDLYTNHKFISAPLDRLQIKASILYPFKWFFSAYELSSPDRINRTQRAFEKLLLVSEVPDNETNQFRTFEEEIKKKAAKEPWFSDAYQGCLYLGNRCIFDKADSKIPFKAAYLYDAVIQFATALHMVRKAGQKPTGENIVNRLKRRRFIGADGHRHHFDENADVVYNYTVFTLRRDKNGELNMLPVKSPGNL